MKAFFSSFFAALLALVVFATVAFLLGVGLLVGLTQSEKPTLGNKAVLVLDLSDEYKEQSEDNPLNSFINKSDNESPSLSKVISLINHAETDSLIKGIYIMCSNNPNGYAASEELRKALLKFKKSKKFVIAYGETISQNAYYLANVADKVYAHPQGGLDWTGMSVNLIFFKGLIDKLEIQPQIFYAGKFKSATEPFRETQMTDANKLQTSIWLSDIYSHFLLATAATRNIDTAMLHQMANTAAIQTAKDAVKYGLIDGIKYDDEIKKIIQEKLQLKETESINFLSFHNYATAAVLPNSYGSEKIAVLFANGEISSGRGEREKIGSDDYKNIIRKLRFDNSVKAIVVRVNSPGGSALASDVIWRELGLARKVKPVIVSMGDVAASGGYYIACNADSIFANQNTITGSIGVFGMIPNLASFLKNKIGLSFDGVKTAPFADMGSMSRPLNEMEKKFVQSSIDSVYASFTSRVAAGRKKSIEYVDTIAQGRVWTGSRAIGIGLADRIGTLQDAIASAARMAKLTDYRIKEFPEQKDFFEQIFNDYKKSIKTDLLKETIGETNVSQLATIKKIEEMAGIPQAKLPFVINIK